MEVLVVIAISAILIAIAVPAFNASIARAKTTDAANSLLAAVELARSEAIRRSVNVSVCRVQSTVTPACSTAAVGANYASGDWAAGWAVFAETNTAGAIGTIDTDEPIVAVQDAFPEAAAPRAGILEAASAGVFTFAPDGTRVGGGALSFNVTYPQAELGAAQVTRTVNVSILGQVSIN